MKNGNRNQNRNKTGNQNWDKATTVEPLSEDTPNKDTIEVT